MRRLIYLIIILCAALNISCLKQQASHQRKMEPVNFSKVEINDRFWKPRLAIHADTTLHVCMDQCEHATNRVKNFAIAAGAMDGEFKGLVYDDSDLYKTIEGVAYSLINQRNPELEAHIDTIIDYIARAQSEDGYLMTYYILGDMDSRWTDMDKHEMYYCGHLIEAAIAYSQATGKDKLLDVAIRFADHLDNTFGPGKRNWVPGHQEIELALVKLYYKTKEAKYLNLAEWLLEQRGHGLATWKSLDYHQDIVPVKQQRRISGHAVRAMYMFTAMADVAAAKNNPEYITALDSLWHGETCASVGMVFWNHRMNLLSGEGKYVDVLERSMYNGVLAGISLSGNRFFYVNPLESYGDHHRKMDWFKRYFIL